MNHAIEFIETPLFTRQIKTIATDDELKASLEEAVEIKKGDKATGRVTRYEIADVKAIREQLNVSQNEMAKALGTSVDTIKSWEAKRRNPTGLAAKVLAVIQFNPAFFHELAAH